MVVSANTYPALLGILPSLEKNPCHAERSEASAFPPSDLPYQLALRSCHVGFVDSTNAIFFERSEPLILLTVLSALASDFCPRHSSLPSKVLQQPHVALRGVAY